MIYGEDGFGSDCFDLNVPRRFLSVSTIMKHGELPFWTELFGSGTPLIEEGETAVFYPLSLLPYFIFSVPLATNVVVFSALLISMLGMYAWLRYNGALPLAAFCGALACGCGGTLAFRIKHLNIIHVLTWLPLSLWCLQLAWDTSRVRYYIAIIIIWLLQILAGHPQFFLICLGVDAFYLLCLFVKPFHSIRMRHNEYRTLRHARCVLLFAGCLLLALCLGSVQLYPTFELLQLSNRVPYDLKLLNDSALSFSHIINWLYPFGLFSIGCFGATEDILPDCFTEATPYIGLLPLLFVFWSFKGKQRFFAISVTLMAVTLTLIALGPKMKVYTLLWHVIPFFSSFRGVARFAAPIGFLMAFLSGLGAQVLYERLASHYGEGKGRAVLLCAIVLIIADFSVIHFKYQRYLPVEWWQEPPSVSVLPKNRGRVLAPLSTMSWRAQIHQGKYNNREQICYAHRDQLGSELSSLWGIYTPDDYCAYNGGCVLNHSYRLQVLLSLKVYAFWMTGQLENPELVRQVFDYYRMQNVTHVILPHRISGGIVKEFFSEPIEVVDPKYSDISVWIYPVKNVQSRVRLISALADKCPDEVMDIDSFWLSSSGVSCYEPGKFGAYDIGSAEIIAETTNTLTVKTKCDQPAHLFIANTYSPHWQAFVDGSAVPLKVQRTNYAFQSVPVSAGEHTVTLEYTCPSFWRGLWISLSGMIALLITALISYRYRRF
ncbi:MAG: YfhO family protein [bacterium]|nr:YfhO family protein [bacterium]